MANVGTGTIGKTLIGAGVGISPTFKLIGSDSGLATYGVVLAQGNNPFTVSSPSTLGQALVSNGSSANPSFGVVGPSGGGSGSASLTGILTGNGTSPYTASPVTQYQTLVAGTSNLVNGVTPSATTGVPLVSQGSSANPTFGTAVVAGGGTGATTLTGVLTGNGTSAFTASPVTQYGTVVAGTSNAVSSIAPSATSGVPYISQGSSANPTFGTAVVAGGGTGNTTFTAYSVIAAGTTATGAFQNVSGVGTAGQVLTSAGAGALPTWAANAAFTVLGVQRITATGTSTYTPTAGTKYARVTLVGAGGGSGGCAATTANIAISGAGGGGATAVFLLTAAQIGASLSVTVGAGGIGGTAGNNAGANGGSTSIASPNWVAAGGSGGAGSAAGTTVSRVGGNGGAVSTSTGTLIRSSSGNGGSNGFGTAATFVVGGFGGASGLSMGMGGLAVSVTLVSGTSTSTTLVGVGGGAGGSVSFGTNGTVAGTAGADGIAIFEEFG